MPSPVTMKIKKTVHRKPRKTPQSAEYSIYHSMIKRCYKPKNPSYPHYGGRGIKVCDEWLGVGGFSKFIEHIGLRPSRLHSIDRIDNNKGYEPGNVRWATAIEQCRNKSDNRMITALGKTQCLSAWVEETGITRGSIKGRLEKGWDISRALTVPTRPKRKFVQKESK